MPNTAQTPPQTSRRPARLRFLYNLIIYLLLPIILVRLLSRGLRNRAYLSRIGERFGRYPDQPRDYDVWIHAVSVGEVNAAGPLARALVKMNPQLRVLLTTMTPTGADQARIAMSERIEHLYLPYDYPFAVRRFLEHCSPKVAIMMETEIWPNFIQQCDRRGIPLVVANLRLSQRSYAKYARLLPFTRSVFRKVKWFAVQTAADRQRVGGLLGHRENVSVTGNIKFEINLPASLREVAQVVRREWGTERTVWVAGSTHEGEEETIIKVFKSLRQRHPSLLLVLVPRHPERFDSVYRLLQKYRLDTVRRSMHAGAVSDDLEVFLGDTMGELPIFFAACDIAFVGGSLTEIGGHNILEACALGKPVIFGPHMFNFLEISQMALERHAGIQVQNEKELESVLRQLVEDANFRYACGQRGIALVEDNQGALMRTLEVLEPFLPDAAKFNRQRT
ncbi:MAG: 3-deoxy-D-manno-octulosonic acid transferase [Proteobacteria bacterium]|nr:MAG: 3-deoxy-D-manno-octulosonic acid transferase [Pseudomonadota bacterium]